MTKKVAIVTGASSGIGLATAKLFVKNGYITYGLSRRKMNEIDIIEIQTDVTDDDSVKAAIARIIEEQGRIDVLFNNAGFAMIGAAEESSIAQVKTIFETNFYGAIRVTNEVLPIMRKQRSGRIIHTSSIVGFVPSPFMTFYGASKHALEGYSESLDHEVRNLGIRSILIEPSFMKTSINSHSFSLDNPIDDYATQRERVAKFVEIGVEDSSSPEIVAKKVIEAATVTTPKVRYPVGKDAEKILPLRRFAPISIFEKIFRSNFKLDL